MNKPKINIGLDIGIASVGWSIVNENREIVKHGVRLFPTTDDAKDSKLKNEKRREMRSFRRQTRRRQTRKRDFILFLLENKFIELNFKYEKTASGRPAINNSELLQAFEAKYKEVFSKLRIADIRQKGLKENLTFEESIYLMYWYLTRRGYSYKVIEKDLEKLEKELNISLKDLPINIETKIYESQGFINGETRRLFSREMWLNEINKILSNQKIDKKIQDNFIDLFNRQRSFEHGPGQEGKGEPSRWSRFNPETGKWDENMWDKTVGKCSIFPDEFRAPKNSLTAELFNLLNDLNNIFVSDPNTKQKFKLDEKQKLEIIKGAFKTKAFWKAFKTVLKENQLQELEFWSGFRVDKKGKRIITELTSLHLFNKNFKELIKPITFGDVFKDDKYIENNKINQWVDICSKTKNTNKRKAQFIETFNLNVKKDEFTQWIESAALNSPAFSSNHALSYKAMNQIIPELLLIAENQMQVIHRLNMRSNEKVDFKNKKYIPTDWINQEILTPTVKRSVRQTVKILNRIIKLYGNKYDIDNIVIELAREHNNKQQRENINNIQKVMENRKTKVKSLIESIESKAGKTISGNVLTKLLLWEEQKGLDAYTGEKLDLDDVALVHNYTDIDHIIPYSISFDNSMSNKVLTLAQENSKKGKNTPFGYLGRDKFNAMKLQWADWYLHGEKKNLKKYNFLIDENDYINDPSLAFGFIARNLVDTRYASKAILNKLTDFFYGKNTKIKVINGRMTSFLRRFVDKRMDPLLRPEINGVNLFNEETWNDKKYVKNRVWHGHHAEDATIAVIGSMIDPKVMKMIEKNLSDPFNDVYEGEKFSKQEKNEAVINTYAPDKSIWLDDLRQELNSKMKEMQFSYKVDKPKTSQLFNETLYGYKEIHGVKWKKEKPIDLFEKTSTDLANLFPDNYEVSPLSMADETLGDVNMYNELRDIYLLYKEESSPFKAAAEASNNKNYIQLKNKRKVRKVIKLSKFTKGKEDKVVWVNNNSGFYDSMEWLAIDVYLNTKGKKVIYPVTALNHILVPGKDPEPKNHIIKNDLEKLNVDLQKSEEEAKNTLSQNAVGTIVPSKENILKEALKIKKLHRLYKGNILELESGELVRLSGSTKQTLEVQYLNALTEKCGKSRWRPSINSKDFKGAYIVHLDVLGKIYKKTKFGEKAKS